MRKNVIISVVGGVADVQQNEGNVKVAIVDYDNGDTLEEITDGSEEVIVEVSGGVAEITKCDKKIKAEIIDYDEEESKA